MTVGRRPLTVKQFWDLLTPEPNTGCWLFPSGGNNVRLYSYANINGRQQGAHRHALELKMRRRIRPGKQANHHCDFPPCCNPDHLYEGTMEQNAKDQARRPRLLPTPAPVSTLRTWRCKPGTSRDPRITWRRRP